MADNKVYAQCGGVVGGKLNVLKATFDASKGLPVGTYTSTITVPAGTGILFATIADKNDTLVGDGATFQLKANATNINAAAVSIDDVKGKIDIEAGDIIVIEEDTPVSVAIAGAALTAGEFEIGVVTLG